MESYLNWILNTDVSDYSDNVNKREVVVTSVFCNDGNSISIQASDGHYCQPRENYSGWYKVEVGFPSATPNLKWKEYFDGQWYDNRFQRFVKNDFSRHIYTIKNLKDMKKYYKTNREFIGYIWIVIKRIFRQLQSPIGCDSVYGYVPVELVWEYINEHDGEDCEKSWEVYNNRNIR